MQLLALLASIAVVPVFSSMDPMDCSLTLDDVKKLEGFAAVLARESPAITKSDHLSIEGPGCWSIGR